MVITNSRDGKVKVEGNYDKINVVRGLVLIISKPYTNPQKQKWFLKSFKSHKWE